MGFLKGYGFVWFPFHYFVYEESGVVECDEGHLLVL